MYKEKVTNENSLLQFGPKLFCWLLGGYVSHGNNVLNKYVYMCVGNFSHGRFHHIAHTSQ